MTQCGYKLSGVLNGIDMKLYDPAADPRIAANYTAENMSGKAADKAAAAEGTVGLNAEPEHAHHRHGEPSGIPQGTRPSSGGHGRHHGAARCSLWCWAAATQRYEDFFRRAAERYPGRMAVRLGYNEALSMAIYAGADLFLMPSRSEPCGLSQMIAMRYGTVPIVRETGGLKDTRLPL